MSTYSATLGASGSWELRATGRFLRLLEASAAVTVTFYKAGREIAEADEMLAGYAETMDAEGFDRVVISGAAGTTFKLAIRRTGRVEYDRGAANVDVASLPDITIAAGQSVAVDTLPGQGPVDIGTSFARAVNVSSVTELIAPSANTGGMLIKAAAAYAGSGNYAMLLCKSSAPSGSSDASAVMLLAAFSCSDALPYPMLIPAGMGVYAFGVSGYVSVSYELL